MELFTSMQKPVRLVARLDADGICAASIMIKILNKQEATYSLSFVRELTDDFIEHLAGENYQSFLFVSTGAEKLSKIKEKLAEKKVMVFDHHEPDTQDLPANMQYINQCQGQNACTIAGAGIVYLFSKQFDIPDLGHLAVLGALSAHQQFIGLNEEILQQAEKIETKQGLQVVQTQPLHKALQHTTFPYIPGVTGSESGALQLLKDVGINPKVDNGYKTARHLTDEDCQKVAEELKRRTGHTFYGDIYTYKEWDAQEFANILNACCRLGKASLAIGCCLGDSRSREKARHRLKEYNRKLIDALEWYEKHQASDKVIKGPGFIIINAQDEMLPSIAGPVAEILSNTKEMPNHTYILSLTHMRDSVKASLRLKGQRPDIDLRQIMLKMTSGFGDAGGMKTAAGGVIAQDKETDFIKAAQEILEQRSMEEAIS